MLHERVELRQLILRERFRGKQIQRARRRVLQNGVEDRQVVAQRLARRRGRHRDDVPARQRVADRLGLMVWVEMPSVQRFNDRSAGPLAGVGRPVGELLRP